MQYRCRAGRRHSTPGWPANAPLLEMTEHSTSIRRATVVEPGDGGSARELAAPPALYAGPPEGGRPSAVARALRAASGRRGQRTLPPGKCRKAATRLPSVPRARPRARARRAAQAPRRASSARTAGSSRRGASGSARSAPTLRIAIPPQGFETEDEVRTGKTVEPPSRLRARDLARRARGGRRGGARADERLRGWLVDQARAGADSEALIARWRVGRRDLYTRQRRAPKAQAAGDGGPTCGPHQSGNRRGESTQLES